MKTKSKRTTRTRKTSVNPVSRATLAGRVRHLENQMLAVQEVLRAYGNAIDDLSEPMEDEEGDEGGGGAEG